MAVCKDPNDPTQVFASQIQPIENNDVSADGVLLPSYVNTALNNFSTAVSATSATTNPIDKFVNEYGQESFDAGLDALNDYFNPTVTVTTTPVGEAGTVVVTIPEGTTTTSPDGTTTTVSPDGTTTTISPDGTTTTVNPDRTTTTVISPDGTTTTTTSVNLSEYEYLETRIEQSPTITTIEYAEYMVELGTNPIQVVELVETNPTEVESQLNDFYQGNFTETTIGSFCALMPSVFAAIENFFNLASSAINWFESLEDLTLAGVIDSLYNQIKSEITRIIDLAVEKVRSIVDNIVADIQRFTRRVQELIAEIKTKLDAFFSEENIERIKNKIQNAIDYVLNVFKNPSLEEIQYLIYRFCSLASQVENAINLLSQPLTDIVNNYNEIFDIVTASSRAATAEAIGAGAGRYGDDERSTLVSDAGSNYPPQSLENIEQEYIDAAVALTWERLLQSNDFRVVEGNNSFGENPPGQERRDGWEKLTLETRAKFIKLQNIYSGLYGPTQFVITSGYRGPELNRAVRGASRSQHLGGRAIDFQWPGFSTATRQEMINIARRRCGFGGIGVYNSFLHVDTGPERQW